MSDADDHMGGQGGETGRAPGEGGASVPPQEGRGAAPAEDDDSGDTAGRSERVDRSGEDSFPASDPPGAP